MQLAAAQTQAVLGSGLETDASPPARAQHAWGHVRCARAALLSAQWGTELWKQALRTPGELDRTLQVLVDHVSHGSKHPWGKVSLSLSACSHTSRHKAVNIVDWNVLVS